jgi:hypothetical protein
LTPIKHGLYSKYAPAKLSVAIEEARQDPALTDIREQAALVAALTQDLLSKIPEGDDGKFIVNGETRGALAELAMKAAKLAEKHSRVTTGEKHTIRIEVVGLIVERVIEVVEQRVADERIRDSIFRDLQEIRMPSSFKALGPTVENGAG